MHIDVVIPVLNQCKYTESLLTDIAGNSVIPKSVTIIDNNSTDDTNLIVRRFEKVLPIRYVKNIRNIGVNASWNLGVSYANHDLVTFLNNDLVLNAFFFETLSRVFAEHPKCGMAYPKSYQGGSKKVQQDYISQVRNAQKGNGLVENVSFREGWAFTLRRGVALKLLIPKELFNYCGDDYHFHFIKVLGYDVLRMLDNPVYHYGNVTGESSGLCKRMAEDTKKWRKMIHEDVNVLVKRAF
jgi:GT2 family glycosyltransferase